jgi:predicted aldo/keto reductase-like oxidoreductase
VSPIWKDGYGNFKEQAGDWQCSKHDRNLNRIVNHQNQLEVKLETIPSKRVDSSNNNGNMFDERLEYLQASSNIDSITDGIKRYCE